MLKIEANSCEGEQVLHHIPFLSLILIYVPPLLELFLSANNTLSYTARKRNLGKWLKILSGMWRILEQTSSAGQGKESEEKIKSSELQKYSTLKNPSPHPLNYEVENLGQSIALFTVNFSHLHYNVFERGCEAISGNFRVSARNCLTSTFKYIVMQMRKVNCEKGYWKRIAHLSYMGRDVHDARGVRIPRAFSTSFHV